MALLFCQIFDNFSTGSMCALHKHHMLAAAVVRKIELFYTNNHVHLRKAFTFTKITDLIDILDVLVPFFVYHRQPYYSSRSRYFEVSVNKLRAYRRLFDLVCLRTLNDPFSNYIRRLIINYHSYWVDTPIQNINHIHSLFHSIQTVTHKRPRKDEPQLIYSFWSIQNINKN